MHGRMLAASILLAALPLAALAQSTPAPSASPSPSPSPTPVPSGTPNSYLSVGYRATSLSVPYGTPSSPRGGYLNFLLLFNANNAVELAYNGDSFGIDPRNAANGGFQTPPPPVTGSTASPIPTNLGSSLNRLEMHYYVMPKALGFGLGVGLASFTNGSQLPQYPSLTGLGVGGALLLSGRVPLYGSLFVYPSLAGSSGGAKASATTYRVGLHVALPSSSLFGEIGFDGESIQNPGLTNAAATPSPFSYNNRGGGTQTRNALTLGIGVKF